MDKENKKKIRKARLIALGVSLVMLAAVSDRALRDIVPEQRDRLRASLLKQMLTVHNM